MRLIDIITRSNSNLFRSKLRTFLTIGAVIIGAATLALTIAIGEGVKTFIDEQVGSFGQGKFLTIQKFDIGSRLAGSGPEVYDPEVTVQDGLQYFAEADIAKVAEVEGIEEVKPFYLGNAEYIQYGDSEKYKINLTPLIEQLQPTILSGEMPASDDETGYFILPYTYLDAFGFENEIEALGEVVRVAYRNAVGEEMIAEYEIKAVLINSLVNGGQGYISSTDIAAITAFQTANTPLEGKFPAIIAVLPDVISDEKIDAIKSELLEMGYQGTTVDDRLETVNGVISAVQIVLSVFAVIAILVSVFGIVNTLLMSVYERTREIGLFRALGMGKGTVFALFSIEAGLIGFFGGLAGVMFAFGVGQLINYFVEQSELFGLEGFELLVFSIPYMAAIIAGLFLVSMFSGLLPARKAANLDPIEALRYE